MTVVLEYCGSIIAPTIMYFLWNGIGALVFWASFGMSHIYPSFKTPGMRPWCFNLYLRQIRSAVKFWYGLS